MSEPQPDWLTHFRIQSLVDLDFVFAQDSGLPVGTTRQSPPEFRRRLLAAHVSHWLGLRSMDYALRRYVDSEQYEHEEPTFGNIVSDFIVASSKSLKSDLLALHTQEDLSYGRFGAEITLFKFPEIIDTARMLANRGLLLEVLPILRMAIEMMAWSVAVFNSTDEKFVESVNAQSCISKLKPIYTTAGEIYGHLSEFSHWRFLVHSYFLKMDGERTAVLTASRRYRAMSLAFSILILDLFVEVIRNLYGDVSHELVSNVQETLSRDNKKTHQLINHFVELSNEDDFKILRVLQK